MSFYSHKQDFEKYAVQRPMTGPVSDDYIKHITSYFQKADKNSNILDFGCGDGRYYDFLKKFFKSENIFGTEISAKRIENCKKIGWDNVFLVKKLEKLPFKDNFFDFVNFDQVIEHISTEEISFYLGEITRVIKPPGIFVVLTPNYPIKRIYDVLIAIKHLSPHKIKDDPTHVTFYNFGKLKAILNSYFNNVKLIPVGGAMHHLTKNGFFSHKIIGICSYKK